MKGKLITIVGIVLIFGYFIAESFKHPSDPTQIVMVGGDTLGRDWGAMADQKIADAAQANKIATEGNVPVYNLGQAGNGTLIQDNEDPYTKDKLNSSNYTTIQDGSGREVITGYDRPEENEDNNNYQTRHQKEKNQTEEPTIIYRE